MSGREDGASGGRFASFWERLNSNFWFIPGLCVLGAVVLFAVSQYLDQVVKADVASLPIVFGGGATAARSVLSTIAGSLITVAATAFSLTIVTLQLASSQYTPRILQSFISDRGLQAVLGVYVATFLYSLLVLRIIRTPEGQTGSFTPVISTTAAVVLALVCVALLVYFIAHVVDLIQASTVIRTAHVDSTKAINDLEDLPESGKEDPEEPAPPRDRPELRRLLSEEPLVLRARESGYVQYLNVGEVAKAVSGKDDEETTIVEIPFGPGAFVSAGLPLVRVWPARKLDSEDEVYDAFYFGKERSFRQDPAFGLRQLSDIALKGISPGVNDPTTSMQAMDRMEAIFIQLGKKSLPVRVREFDGGRVIVEAGFYGFADTVGLAFDQLRRSAFTSGQVAVLELLLEVIERAIRANEPPERRRALWARAYTIASSAPDEISNPSDAVNLVLRAVEVARALEGTELEPEVLEDLDDLALKAEDLPGGERVGRSVRTFGMR
jgi:uncharacterized membrane protein